MSTLKERGSQSYLDICFQEGVGLRQVCKMLVLTDRYWLGGSIRSRGIEMVDIFSIFIFLGKAEELIFGAKILCRNYIDSKSVLMIGIRIY